MTNEQLTAYREAAAAANNRSIVCRQFFTFIPVIAHMPLETDIPALATAVADLCAEVERLQSELRVAEQRIADFYETGEMP